MSAAIGAALAGARTITATSSQGLALMAEVVYIAAAMRAPIVMALGNRALSGPINIHCDHSDSMLDPRLRRRAALRRERAGGLRPDGHGAAPRRAPGRAAARARLPGRVHDHAFRRAGRCCSTTRRCARSSASTAIPNAAARRRAPDDAGPVRDAGLLLRAAAPAGSPRCEARSPCSTSSPSSSAALRTRSTGRSRPTALDGAERAIVASARAAGTVKDVVDELRDDGETVGLLKIGSFRPFPAARGPRALRGRARGRRARPRRLAGRRAAALRRGRGRPHATAASSCAATSTASAAATCTRPTSARSSQASRRRLRRRER